MTPVQEIIHKVNLLQKGNHNPTEQGMISAFLMTLEYALEKEKEFVGKCFEAGFSYGVQASHHPNQQQFLNQLYPEK